jgi:hypothetical protein
VRADEQGPPTKKSANYEMTKHKNPFCIITLRTTRLVEKCENYVPPFFGSDKYLANYV